MYFKYNNESLIKLSVCLRIDISDALIFTMDVVKKFV